MDVLNDPRTAIWLAGLLNEAFPTEEPVKVPAVTVAASAEMVPASASVTVPVPAFTAPTTARFDASARVRLPLAVLNDARTAIWLAGLLNDAFPTEEPVRVPAMIVAASAEIDPASVSVRVPVPALTVPVTARLAVSASVRLPLDVLNDARVAIWLDCPRIVSPTDDPVKVPVVIAPALWLIAAAEVSVVCWAASVLRFAPSERDPPACVVRARLPAPASTAPVTVKPEDLASVTLIPPAPTLVKPPRVSN